VAAIVEALAELEGVDPLELEPLNNYINPDVFTQLQMNEDSQWQLLFYADTYEVRVSSLGTVTVYELNSPKREIHG
jgi:hypothetical protein